MANYTATARTNYFRVTDESRYQKLISNLSGNDIQHFTKNQDGVIYHGFGAYDSIEYKKVISCSDGEDAYEDYDYDFDEFLFEIQKILPDDEAFMYFESGHENLRYVTGVVIVCTNKEIRSMSMDTWAMLQAKELLGDDFDTQTSY